MTPVNRTKEIDETLVKEKEAAFAEYIQRKGLKTTRQRNTIIGVFFRLRGHISVEELLNEVKKVNSRIGYATVYRTLHLLVESNLVEERRFGDGLARYEGHSDVEHHDHMICLECGDISEFYNPRLEALQEKLAEQGTPFSDSDLQLAYESLLPSLSTVCTRHILVETEEQAEAVVDRLDGGEEFADLAAELSIDAGSGAAGGDIGCISDPSANLVSTYAAAALDAEIGEVTGPVPSEFGYHVLIVDSREAPVFDEIRVDLEASMEGERAADLFDDWVFEQLGKSDIAVTERYGTWQTEPTFGVNSPA